MKRSVLLTTVLFLGMGSVRLSAELVHLSRYVQRMPSQGNSVFIQIVPLTVLREYCGDAEGCKVGLRLEDEVELAAKGTRFYIGEADSQQWLSEASQTAGMHRDGDDDADDILTVIGTSSSCTFADNDGGIADQINGFSVQGITSPVFVSTTCTLIIED